MEARYSQCELPKVHILQTCLVKLQYQIYKILNRRDAITKLNHYKVFTTNLKTFDSPKNKDIKYNSILMLQHYASYAFIIWQIFWSQTKLM